jgi:hypothetical protein
MLANAAGYSESISLPKDVVVALNENAKQLDNLSIRFQRTRSTNMPIEQLFKQINGLREYGFFETSDHTFVWKSPCFYHLDSGKYAVKLEGTDRIPFAYENNLDLRNTIQEKSFDGKNYMFGGGHKRSEDVTPGIGIDTKEQVIRDVKNNFLLDSIYLWAAGYKFPIIGEDIGTTQMSGVLFLTSQGQIRRFEKQVIGGEELIMIEILARDFFIKDNRIFSLWVSPKHNYINKKFEVKTLDGKKVYEVENSDFTNVTPNKLYFPKKCKITYYSWRNNPSFVADNVLFTEEYNLTYISTKNIAMTQFDLRKKYSVSGTVVADRTLKDTDAGVQYIVPANPADLDRVIESALTGKDFVPTPIQPMWMFVLRLILCVVGTAMALYGGYLKFIKKPK